jgi:hypothetical protein
MILTPTNKNKLINTIFNLTIIYSIACPYATGETLDSATRQAILNSVRPVAQSIVEQPVKFKVDRLNVDGNWAILIGELRNPKGGPLNWNKTNGCNADLDKGLWVVLARADESWRVAQIHVCDSEPETWSIPENGGFLWPCGVYAGLQGVNGEKLEHQCRRMATNIKSQQ